MAPQASPSGSVSFSFSRHSLHYSNQFGAYHVMAVASEKPMSPLSNPDTFTPRPGLVHIPVIPWI
jgi:hypothetical protein